MSNMTREKADKLLTDAAKAISAVQHRAGEIADLSPHALGVVEGLLNSAGLSVAGALGTLESRFNREDEK